MEFIAADTKSKKVVSFRITRGKPLVRESSKKCADIVLTYTAGIY